LMEKCHITLNKNAVPGDTKPFVPGGVRIGTPALTTRGFRETDFARVADFLDRGIKLALKINGEGDNSKVLKNFKQATESNRPEIVELAKDVKAFATTFPMPA